MSDNKPLLKTCNNCGQAYPLSAFLQLSSTAGGIYGNICANCRGLARPPSIEKEEDGSQKTTHDLKIDAKTILKTETDKITHKQAIEKLNQQALEKQAELKTQKDQKIIRKAKAEKEHRENYLEKQSFLDSTKTAKRIAAQAPANIQSITAKEQSNDIFSTPFFDTYISGKEKYKGTAIKSFRTLLGKEGAKIPPSDTNINLNKPEKINKQEKLISEKIEEKWVPKPKGPSTR